MPPSNCLRGLSQLSLETTTRGALAPRLTASQNAYFSTSTSLRAVQMKKQTQKAAPKKGVKTLNTKKSKKGGGPDTGKRPAQGERKALRKRIVLSNNNALEVTSLQDLSKENVLGSQIEGKVMGLPEQVVDALRAVEAFKLSQGWSLFRRPAMLMRKEAVQFAKLFAQVEEAAKGKSQKTIRRILTGQRLSGKSTILLQALSVGFLRDWFVINLPEAQEIVNAHTEYAPLPDSEPLKYTQDTYTAKLLQQILKANGKFLESTKVKLKHDLPAPLPGKAPSLKELVASGMAVPETSWPVFMALWKELSQPGYPPILFGLDGLSHVMGNSKYISADLKPVHAFDLTLINHFIDHLSGKSSLPNGGIVLGATSKSNSPTSTAMEFCIEVAEARQNTPDNVPQWNPYKSVDARVMEALKDLENPKADLEVVQVGGLSKEEARAIMEYYAESGMLKQQVSDGFVSEKWSLAGMGNIGELERANVRMRI